MICLLFAILTSDVALAQQPQAPASSDNSAALSVLLINEIGKEGPSQAQTFGAEGNREFPKYELEGTLTGKHEAGHFYFDEGRLAAKRKFDIRGHEFAAGPTVWHDIVIDSVTKVGGGEVSTVGPMKLELTGGAYAGRISDFGVDGRLLMSWAQVDRKMGPVEVSYENYRGKIRAPGDATSFGQGTFKKDVFNGEIDLRALGAPHWVPNAVASVEIKRLGFGPGGPAQSEVVTLVGVNIPAVDWAGGAVARLHHVHKAE
jgi:hypothetical protein